MPEGPVTVRLRFTTNVPRRLRRAQRQLRRLARRLRRETPLPALPVDGHAYRRRWRRR
jgi:hypothetical protein